ncbi:MAG: type II secretion system GspH family protein, partial [Phycisphaerales bacterium]|nr:type II secretion system GspH family protein [Phycisphaerales bacterium]
MERRLTTCGRRSRDAGFTLVELLVVIGLVAALIALIFYALSSARQTAFQVKCSSNQKQIGKIFLSYCFENEMRPHEWRNYRSWLDPLDPDSLIDIDAGCGHWGVAYAHYAGLSPKDALPLFTCPSCTAVDADPYGCHSNTLTSAEGGVGISYGFNGWGIWADASEAQTWFGGNRTAFFNSETDEGATISIQQKPAETLVCHDAFETMLDGNGDTLDTVTQVDIFRTNDAYDIDEYCRHGNGKQCVALWQDGHVAAIQVRHAEGETW